MASTPRTGALDWLAAAQGSAHLGSGLLLLPAGQRWDVLLAPGRLGHHALAVLIRLARPGPVYADFGDEHLGFLVPVGTAGRWVGTGLRGAGAGTWVVLPHPARRGSSGVRWLVPPDGSGALTDPVVFELALHEAAAELYRTEQWPSTPRPSDDL
ncbi:hypothetical protein [Kitasatospora sp. GP82]|uniref:hypothetical protein n=1 Tax=Kitasatospora sp. GP82 TaxID=3035089 RepID=UPI002476B226|nr:hypothetical protein [Kitasatospora sp. GP82]MDH6129150.1 hypothetical protein [Kitasatospora sp. GP82]